MGALRVWGFLEFDHVAYQILKNDKSQIYSKYFARRHTFHPSFEVIKVKTFFSQSSHVAYERDHRARCKQIFCPSKPSIPGMGSKGKHFFLKVTD